MTNIKERPILFNARMVRAILEGSKSVTLREVKKQAALDCLAAGFEPAFLALPGNADLCPYGKPGERLWVRETWLPDPDADHEAWDEHTDTYFSWSGCGSKIDGVPPGLRTPEHCIYREGWKGSALMWRPSIHMPRWASRILLEVTHVQVERLNAITADQALAEGIQPFWDDNGFHVEDGKHYADNPVESLASFWHSINGTNSWEANPWVWVVEFKRVTL
jgi:hypothetical protein